MGNGVLPGEPRDGRGRANGVDIVVTITSFPVSAVVAVLDEEVEDAVAAVVIKDNGSTEAALSVVVVVWVPLNSRPIPRNPVTTDDLNAVGVHQLMLLFCATFVAE
jgi:hypothetical protein